MKPTVLSLLLLCCFLACTKENPAAGPVSVQGEKVYAIRGKVVSKTIEKNRIELDHEAIPGFMEAMTMAYSVRGASVKALPADGSRVEGKLHVTDEGYWLSDLKKAP